MIIETIHSKPKIEGVHLTLTEREAVLLKILTGHLYLLEEGDYLSLRTDFFVDEPDQRYALHEIRNFVDHLYERLHQKGV